MTQRCDGAYFKGFLQVSRDSMTLGHFPHCQIFP